MSNTSKKNAKITGTDQITVGEGREFERIRRITGYLVGTIDRWCAAMLLPWPRRMETAAPLAMASPCGSPFMPPGRIFPTEWRPGQSAAPRLTAPGWAC